ncbi:Ribose 5-phosphate isomerase [mine drainage metagenome]|uniref:ribose-5-phosphate isomerase n=1 Tax=mine drainage metagenome TaxID=410659 RepID=T0ZAT0_9ZZZZ
MQPTNAPPWVEKAKRLAAEAALSMVQNVRYLGVGTGSTARYFIEGLAKIQDQFDGAVASSEQTSALLRQAGIPVLDLNETGDIDLYVDGTDAFDPHFRLIKGHGGALTREKILATASRRFIVIADESKRFDRLGDSVSVPVEVIPFARSYVARQIVRMGGTPALRERYLTDNGNQILDVLSLPLADPSQMEHELQCIPGVVETGIFAERLPDLILMATSSFVVERLKAV